MRLGEKGFIKAYLAEENDILIQDNRYDNFNLFDRIQCRITNISNVKSFYDSKRHLGHSIDIIDNCNIRIFFANSEITLTEAENCLSCVFDGKFYEDKELTGYSEYTITGYEIIKCEIGGHNLVDELSSHIGDYMIFIMEF